MSSTVPPVLASLDASRPVFLVLMGLALLLVAWRLVRRSSGWPAWTLMSGAVLLAFGYSVLLPLYTLKIVRPLSFVEFFPEMNSSAALGWHLAKLFAMNGGWLLFGLGLALHARLFAPQPQAS